MADRTSGEISIDATPAEIMDVIGDLAQYPEWSDGVKGVEIERETADGRPEVARFTFASGPLADTFVLEYVWHGLEWVDWRLIEGGVITRYDGTYTLTANPDGTVAVKYDLVVALTVPIIGALKQRAEKLIVKTALHGLKNRVESLG